MQNTNIALSGKSAEYRPNAPKTQVMIWQIVRTLSEIDAEYYLQVSDIEGGATDADLKAHLMQKLRASHRARRQAYVHQLEELRQQR
ncbi:hypothetical protein [Microvirga vignae]|nr:hypothetical protein [Microvirga vignae]